MNKAKENRPFVEVEGGKTDENGFYRTPNGSFWDVDGVYFNREGVDVHGGHYDKEFNYHPGEGWIESLMCYEDEVNPNDDIHKSDSYHDDLGDDYEDGDYDVYEDIQDDMRASNLDGPSYYDVALKEPKSTTKTEVKVKASVESKDKSQYSEQSAYSSNTNPKVQKEKVNVESVSNLNAQEALKNHKEVSCKGYTITEDLLSDDDEQSGKKKGKK